MDLSRFGWRTIMTTACIAMLVQQAFSYVCQMVMPLMADRLAEDFDISPAWLGLYLFIQNIASIIAAIGCGSFILRYGPLRISQWALLLMGGSLLVIATGQLWLYPLGAILLGASAVSTPASSHILARVCPPRLAPLVFSIKQTGVPVGSLIGGLLLPFLLGLVIYTATFGTAIRLGPYGTALVTAGIVALVAFGLQPLRAFFDDERRADIKIAFGDLRKTLGAVVSDPSLRDISFAAFAFGGQQSLFAGFFILFLIDDLGYSEVEAGSTFAIASFSAIWARIAWGALGGRMVSPRLIMAGIGFFGAVAGLLTAGYDFTWGFWEIVSVAILYNITALSWHGILLSETARLAPEGQVGGITGGVLSFTSIAMMIYPAIFGIILAATDSYAIGFALGAIPAFAACLIFLNPPLQGSWLGFVGDHTRTLATPRGMAGVLGLLGVGTAIGIAMHAAGL